MECYAKCIENRRWDLWKYVFPVASYPKKLLPPFRKPKKDQPWTTIPSTIDLYKGGRSGRDFMRKIPGIQRLASGTLIADGLHDWYLLIDCALKCKDKGCD